MVYLVVVFLQRANCSKMLKYSKCNVILNSEPDKNKIKVRSKISLHSPYIAYIGPVILLFYPTFNCFEPAALSCLILLKIELNAASLLFSSLILICKTRRESSLLLAHRTRGHKTFLLQKIILFVC